MNRQSFAFGALAPTLLCLLTLWGALPTANAAEPPAPAPGEKAVSDAATNDADRCAPYNGAMYRFNVGIDRAMLRPLAQGYARLPRPVRGGIGNFIGHLAYPDTIVNNFLQGKFRDGGKDLARFTLNTVVGLGGLFDPATAAGLQKNDEDFGQTLGAWGVPSGPYLVLPFLGASTVRDAPTWAVTNLLDGRSYIDQDAARYSLAALRLVDVRASVLVADASVDQAFDPYAFVRDAYLQRREYLVKDGAVPEEEFEIFEDEPAQ